MLIACVILFSLSCPVETAKADMDTQVSLRDQGVLKLPTSLTPNTYSIWRRHIPTFIDPKVILEQAKFTSGYRQFQEQYISDEMKAVCVFCLHCSPVDNKGFTTVKYLVLVCKGNMDTESIANSINKLACTHGLK